MCMLHIHILRYRKKKKKKHFTTSNRGYYSHSRFFSSGLKVMLLIAVCTVRTEGRFHRVQMYTNDTHGKNTEVWIVQTHFQRDLSAKTFLPVSSRSVLRGRIKPEWCCTAVIFTSLSDIETGIKHDLPGDGKWRAEVGDHLKNAPKLAKRVFQTSAKSCFRGTPTLFSAPAATATTTSIFKLWNVLNF